MKIEIEYNGSTAKCFITSYFGSQDILVPFATADEFSQIYALGAFHCIKECWEREKKQKNK